MATPDFHYQDPFPIEKDDTQYRLITSDYVSVGDFEGHPMLKVNQRACACWPRKPSMTWPFSCAPPT